jgi:hypothetical protein
MDKSEFLRNLKWIVGPPPKVTGCHCDEFESRPIAIKTKDGEVYTVGDVNFAGGVCDCCAGPQREDVTGYAYLWEDEQ